MFSGAREQMENQNRRNVMKNKVKRRAKESNKNEMDGRRKWFMQISLREKVLTDTEGKYIMPLFFFGHW